MKISSIIIQVAVILLSFLGGILFWSHFKKDAVILEVRHTSNDSIAKTDSYYLPIDTALVKKGNFLKDCHRPKGALVVWKVDTNNQMMSGAYVTYTLVDDQGCIFHHKELLSNTDTFAPRLSVGDTINKGKFRTQHPQSTPSVLEVDTLKAKSVVLSGLLIYNR